MLNQADDSASGSQGLPINAIPTPACPGMFQFILEGFYVFCAFFLNSLIPAQPVSRLKATTT